MKATVERFYTSFAAKDAEGMAACYADEVVFSDPAFGTLEGEHARNMWRMLVSRGKDLEVTFSDVSDAGARWEARYTFSPTGRRVHNVIEARFVFSGDRIVRHDDGFDLGAWCRQAFGPLGIPMAWSAWLQGRFRAKARSGLDAWEAKRKP